MNTGLKVLRVERKLSATDMGKIIGLTAMSYYKKESGATRFTLDEVCTLANALKLTLDDVNRLFFDGRLKKKQK